jgi:hypothetical protein
LQVGRTFPYDPISTFKGETLPSERKPLPPAPLGNRRAERHGAYVTHFTPTELEEGRQIEDKLRELTPIDSEALAPTFSVLAGQLWRRDRLLADLDRHGVVRGRADRGRVAPAVVALTELERTIARNLDALAMLPKAAADLNLTLTRTREAERGDFDPGRLTIKERQTLEHLLTKAETPDA